MSDQKLPPSRTADQYVLRFPDGMRDRIADEAKSHGRSMNAEIVARLQASLDGLSLPESILDRLRESAAKNKRPVATELLHRVLDTFAEDERPNGDELRNLLEKERAISAELRRELAAMGGIPPLGSIAAVQRSVEELQDMVRSFGELVRAGELPNIPASAPTVEKRAKQHAPTGAEEPLSVPRGRQLMLEEPELQLTPSVIAAAKRQAAAKPDTARKFSGAKEDTPGKKKGGR